MVIIMYMENNLSFDMDPDIERKLASFNKELVRQEFEPVQVRSDTALAVIDAVNYRMEDVSREAKSRAEDLEGMDKDPISDGEFKSLVMLLKKGAAVLRLVKNKVDEEEVPEMNYIVDVGDVENES